MDSWSRRSPPRHKSTLFDFGGIAAIEIAGLFGMIAFVATSLAVGIRILLLAARTRLFPETTVGLSLFLAGGVGTALLIAPLFLKDPEPQTPYLLYQFGTAICHVGYGLLFVFVWRVFRREEKWALALYAVCTAGLLVGAVGMALELQPEAAMLGEFTSNSVWFWISLGARFVGYVWASAESLRYYGMLKKRLELGLADAAVASRFLYWGVSLSAVVVIWINTAVQQLMSGSEDVRWASLLITAVLGLLVAVSLWFAFFPRRPKAVASGGVSDAAEGVAQ